MTLINGESVKIEKGGISKTDDSAIKLEADDIVKDVLNDSQGQDEIRQKILERIETGYDVLEDYTEANKIKVDKPQAVKLLGSKAVNSLKLTQLSQQVKETPFHTPSQLSIPMSIPIFIQLRNQTLYSEYLELIRNLDTCSMWRVEVERPKILAILTKMYHMTDDDPLRLMIEQIQRSFQKKDILVAVRSSSTLEDLKKMAGAGLFDSILNVQLSNYQSMR